MVKNALQGIYRHSYRGACCKSAVRCKQCIADLVVLKDISG